MVPAGIGHSLEGLHAVSAALRAGRLTHLLVERSRLDHPQVAPLVEECRRLRLDVEVVADLGPLTTTTAPQGVAALARPIETVGLEEVVSATQPAALAVLDHLEDAHNVGAIARSAAAAGLGGLVVPTRRAAPLGPTAFKAASGALEHLPVAMVSSTAEALRALQKLGLWLVGLVADGDRSLFGLELLSEPVALVVGAEGRGLGRLVEERLDVRARIPMVEPVESLNASVAAGLAAFEVARVRGRVE
ncbi:MAG: 23S rRNA (guanosine(2251)-2'-O)-methyltransferase RlmB [Actinomycetota bacterium]|nr:23S rRNA (guanosine(2251)-2'-O)-methyltransferase RlmB [Actinomycetota bacterium]